MNRVGVQWVATALVSVSILLSSSVWAASEAEKALLERIKPVGSVCVGGQDCGSASSASGANGDAPFDAKGTYTTFCSACHNSGIAQAPIVGEEAAWQERIAKGLSTMTANAIKGFNAMPPKGTCMSCSDGDIKSIVAFMVEESGGSASKPAAPATPANSDPTPSAESASSAASYDLAAGKNTYNTYCVTCHATGAAGAPVLGDRNLWQSRISQGFDTLLNRSVNGFNAMPPKGLCMGCSDEDLANTVAFMVQESGGMPASSSAGGSSDSNASASDNEADSASMDYQPSEEAVKIYQTSCFTCHDTGAAGAPILGDKATWAARIAKGNDALMSATVNGLNAMPPKGLCFDCSDAELQAVVEYMVQSSQ